MYNLHLSPEQLEIRDTVRDFVAREVKPVALATDRLEARERPLLLDPLDQASQLGLRALALGENAGGAGADNLTCCIVIEELAAGDPDMAAVLAQTWTRSAIASCRHSSLMRVITLRAPARSPIAMRRSASTITAPREPMRA
jgi:alkylation response protein AidB-like acyl-CoA dehydrogenase